MQPTSGHTFPISALHIYSENIKGLHHEPLFVLVSVLPTDQFSPGGVIVARLSIDGAEFWLSDQSPKHGNFSLATVGGGTVRMILTVVDPETFFSKALELGVTEVFPIKEDYGWKLGRLVDPFGHHWEIGHQLQDQ